MTLSRKAAVTAGDSAAGDAGDGISYDDGVDATPDALATHLEAHLNLDALLGSAR